MRHHLTEDESHTHPLTAPAAEPPPGTAAGDQLAVAQEEDRRYRRERSDRYQGKITAAQQLESGGRWLAVLAGAGILLGSLLFVFVQLLLGRRPGMTDWVDATPGSDPLVVLYLWQLGISVATIFAGILLQEIGRAARRVLLHRSERHLVEVHDPGDPPE